MALVFAMVLGATASTTATCCAPGARASYLTSSVPAPSTLGTFLRAFTFGAHPPAFNQLLAESLTRAWQAGAGPGTGS